MFMYRAWSGFRVHVEYRDKPTCFLDSSQEIPVELTAPAKPRRVTAPQADWAKRGKLNDDGMLNEFPLCGYVFLA